MAASAVARIDPGRGSQDAADQPSVRKEGEQASAEGWSGAQPQVVVAGRPWRRHPAQQLGVPGPEGVVRLSRPVGLLDGFVQPSQRWTPEEGLEGAFLGFEPQGGQPPCRRQGRPKSCEGFEARGPAGRLPAPVTRPVCRARMARRASHGQVWRIRETMVSSQPEVRTSARVAMVGSFRVCMNNSILPAAHCTDQFKTWAIFVLCLCFKHVFVFVFGVFSTVAVSPKKYSAWGAVRPFSC